MRRLGLRAAAASASTTRSSLAFRGMPSGAPTQWFERSFGFAEPRGPNWKCAGRTFALPILAAVAELFIAVLFRETVDIGRFFRAVLLEHNKVFFLEWNSRRFQAVPRVPWVRH